MSFHTKSLLVLSTLLFAVGCDAASADRSTRARNVVSGAELTLPEAIAAATASVPGVVVDAELEIEARTPVYEVRVLADATLTKVHVDPANGAVLRSEPDTDADDIADAVADAAILQGSALDVLTAIATAEAERPGSVAFEFEVSDGLLEVEVLADAGLFEIHIDPSNGTIVKTESSDDLDDDDDGDHDDDSDDEHDDDKHDDDSDDDKNDD